MFFFFFISVKEAIFTTASVVVVVAVFTASQGIPPRTGRRPLYSSSRLPRTAAIIYSFSRASSPPPHSRVNHLYNHPSRQRVTHTHTYGINIIYLYIYIGMITILLYYILGYILLLYEPNN